MPDLAAGQQTAFRDAGSDTEVRERLSLLDQYLLTGLQTPLQLTKLLLQMQQPAKVMQQSFGVAQAAQEAGQPVQEVAQAV